MCGRKGEKKEDEVEKRTEQGPEGRWREGGSEGITQ